MINHIVIYKSICELIEVIFSKRWRKKPTGVSFSDSFKQIWRLIFWFPFSFHIVAYYFFFLIWCCCSNNKIILITYFYGKTLTKLQNTNTSCAIIVYVTFLVFLMPKLFQRFWKQWKFIKIYRFLMFQVSCW